MIRPAVEIVMAVSCITAKTHDVRSHAGTGYKAVIQRTRGVESGGSMR